MDIEKFLHPKFPENLELLSYARNALMAGKGKDMILGHSEKYFSDVPNADKKEFFAMMFSAYVNYNPGFFRAFPEAREYMEKMNKQG